MPYNRLFCLAPFLLGSVVYALVSDPALPIVPFELAGDAATANVVVAGHADAFRSALRADWFAFIPGYALSIVLSCRRFSNRALAAIGGALAIGAAGCDVAENSYLWLGLAQASDHAYRLGARFAIVKFALVTPAFVLAMWALIAPTHRRSAAEV